MDPIHKSAFTLWALVILFHPEPARGQEHSGESFRLEHGAPQAWVLFHPSGTHLVTASAAAPVKIWEISGRRVVQELPGFGDPTLSLAAGGKALAMEVDRSNVTVYDLDLPSMRATARTTIQAEHNRVALSPDGEVLAVSDGHGGRLIAVSTGRELARMSSEFAIEYLEFTPGGNQVLGQNNDEICSWQVPSGAQQWRIQWASPGRLRISPDGSSFLMKAGRSGFALGSTSTGKPLLTDLPFFHAAFHPDGKRLVVWGPAQHPDYGRPPALHLLTLATGQRLPQPRTWWSYRGTGEQLAVSPDGHWLTLGVARGSKVLFYPAALDDMEYPVTHYIEMPGKGRGVVQALRITHARADRTIVLRIEAGGMLQHVTLLPGKSTTSQDLRRCPPAAADLVLRAALPLLTPDPAPSPGAAPEFSLELEAVAIRDLPNYEVDLDGLHAFNSIVARTHSGGKSRPAVARLVTQARELWKGASSMPSR